MPMAALRHAGRNALAALALSAVSAAVPVAAEDPPAAAGVSGHADTPEQALSRLAAHLEGLRTMAGSYAQSAADGTRAEGTFAIEFPDRFHFAETSPTRNRLISDGFWIATLEEGADQAVRYPLSSTPLSVLLKGGLDDPERVEVLSSRSWPSDEGGRNHLVQLALRGKQKLGNVTLSFSESPTRLKGWLIRDAQGSGTLITLAPSETGAALDPNLFRIHLWERR